MRFTVLALALCAASLTFAQKAATVVGTWVADASEVKKQPQSKAVEINFKADGTFTLKGYNTTGSGKYTLAANKLKITLSKRNGAAPKATDPASVNGSVTEGGKAILLETGVYHESKPVVMRLVRKSPHNSPT